MGEYVQVYLWSSSFILVLSLASFVFILASTFVKDKQLGQKMMENSIQLSWFLQTIPSLLMIMAFLIENIAVGFGWASLGTGYFCDAVAFCAVTTVITLNGTSTTIAFLTYRLMATRKTPSASWAIAGNALSWLFGELCCA